MLSPLFFFYRMPMLNTIELDELADLDQCECGGDVSKHNASLQDSLMEEDFLCKKIKNFDTHLSCPPSFDDVVTEGAILSGVMDLPSDAVPELSILNKVVCEPSNLNNSEVKSCGMTGMLTVPSLSNAEAVESSHIDDAQFMNPCGNASGFSSDVKLWAVFDENQPEEVSADVCQQKGREHFR